jgi:hypothetical protein
MPHRITRDNQIFPRMNKDMDRHNKRLRDAIKKNLSQRNFLRKQSFSIVTKSKKNSSLVCCAERLSDFHKAMA